MNLKTFTLQQVGTDAEVFLEQKGTNIPISVEGKVGGTKVDPKSVPLLGQGFAVQEDNVMLEFNIPPCYTPEAFNDSISKMLAYLKKQMYEQDLILSITASKHFPPLALLTEQAMTFGCEPDFNAWTGKKNEINLGNPILETMRTAAAHIHVSYFVDGLMPKQMEDSRLVVRAHDLFIGVPSVLLDSDTERRKIYGKAGAFRPKHYGIEYRTCGNFWIAEESTRMWVHKQARNALGFVSTAKGVEDLTQNAEVMDSIQACINGNDIAIADWLVNKYNISLPA